MRHVLIGGAVALGIFAATGAIVWGLVTALDAHFGTSEEIAERYRVRDQDNQKRCLDRAGDLTLWHDGTMKSCLIRGKQ